MTAQGLQARARAVEEAANRLADLLRLLNRLGGLGLDKHRWIDEALAIYDEARSTSAPAAPPDDVCTDPDCPSEAKCGKPKRAPDAISNSAPPCPQCGQPYIRVPILGIGHVCAAPVPSSPEPQQETTPHWHGVTKCWGKVSAGKCSGWVPRPTQARVEPEPCKGDGVWCYTHDRSALACRGVEPEMCGCSGVSGPNLHPRGYGGCVEPERGEP